MKYELDHINEMVKTDPKGFVEECDANYQKNIVAAADKICQNMEESPIVLLAGPSGSGKTTSARKIEEELKNRGINTYTVSMDDYFKTIDPRTAPRTREGEINFESPLCVDMELLNEHFTKLNRGEEIHVPHFMFARQKRSASMFTPMKLEKNEIVIFEGIHALNDEITDRHPEALKVYVSAESRIMKGRTLFFRGKWMRMVRRVVRDNLFRGADAQFTLEVWPNVMRGERDYILPYKYKANMVIDSALPYEVPVLKPFALPLIENLDKKPLIKSEIDQVMDRIVEFEDMDRSYVKENSLICEFIGGGIYGE